VTKRRRQQQHDDDDDDEISGQCVVVMKVREGIYGWKALVQLTIGVAGGDLFRTVVSIVDRRMNL